MFWLTIAADRNGDSTGRFNSMWSALRVDRDNAETARSNLPHCPHALRQRLWIQMSERRLTSPGSASAWVWLGSGVSSYVVLLIGSTHSLVGRGSCVSVARCCCCCCERSNGCISWWELDVASTRRAYVWPLAACTLNASWHVTILHLIYPVILHNYRFN